MDRVQTALPCLLQQKGNLEKTVFLATFTVTDSLIIIWSGTASMYFACALGLCSGSGKEKGLGKILFSPSRRIFLHALIRWLMFTFTSPEDWYPLVQFQNVAPFNKRPSAEALLQTWCIINGPPVTFVTRAWNRLARIHPETVETNGGISWYEGVSKWKWQENNDKWLKKHWSWIDSKKGRKDLHNRETPYPFYPYSPGKLTGSNIWISA